MAMKPDRLEFFRFMLTQEINKLLSEAEKTVSEMTNGKENYPDPNDRASLESDRILNCAFATGSASSSPRCARPSSGSTTARRYLLRLRRRYLGKAPYGPACDDAVHRL